MEQPRRSPRLAACVPARDAAPSVLIPGRRTKRQVALGRRLRALPPELLRLVLRAAGRPTRLVCRHFHHAYGPRPCALLIPSTTTLQDILALGPQLGTPSRSPHVHALYFSDGNSLYPSHALLSALARTYPNLRSLPLSMRDAAPPEAISALSPLDPTLTHFAIERLTPQGAAALAAALPSLRSLECSITFPDSNQHHLHPVLDALAGRLPHLRALSVHSLSIDRTPQPTAALLQQLAGGLPHLTRLDLNIPHLDWDSEAAATLASAWPQLAHISYCSNDGLGVGAAAALARHTALTHLNLQATNVPEWHLLRSLPIRELEFKTRDGTWPARAAAFSAITQLTLHAAPLCLDATMAGPLMQLGDSLLSLCLTGSFQGWGDLVHLSRLTKLQDLTLMQWTSWPWEQGTTAGQAAAGLAAGLSSLRCLDVSGLRQHLLSCSLVACPGVHGTLRELHVQEWDPRWPVRLQAVASTLVRLTVRYRKGSDVPLLISSLKGLTRLHDLCLGGPLPAWDAPEDAPYGQYGGEHQLLWVEVRDPPGRRPAPAEPDATAWPEWGQLKAGAAAAADEEVVGVGQVWLPPQLRVLHVPELQSLEHKLQGVLRDAAQWQGCALWGDAPSPYPVELDDCMGYEEGATIEWLRQRGRL